MIGELTQFAEGAATVEMAGKSKRPVAILPVIVGLSRPEIAISATSACELPFDTANNGSGPVRPRSPPMGQRPKAELEHFGMLACKQPLK